MIIHQMTVRDDAGTLTGRLFAGVAQISNQAFFFFPIVGIK